jgi:type II secretory pathway pseudopilin PulG
MIMNTVSEMKNKRAVRSFTLLEILVSVAVFSSAMVLGGSAFYYIHKSWVKQRDYLEVIKSAYWAMDFMATELRQAKVLQLRLPGWDSWNNIPFRRIYARTQVSEDSSLENIFYWRGNKDRAHETDDWGYTGNIYRAQTNSDKFDPFGAADDAQNHRRLLTGYIVDNPGGNFFYSEINGLITLELTLRPFPDRPEGSGNRNYTITTKIRRRNG